MSALVWSESYNIHSASIGGGTLRLVVAWNVLDPRGAPGGYRVTVGNRRLVKLFRDVDEGRAAAIHVARKLVAAMAAELNDSPTRTEKKAP